MMRTLVMYFFIFAVLVGLTILDASAQCAMCKAVQNSSGFNFKGLNTGILYLMIIPYIAFSALGYFWYKASKKEKKKVI